MGAQIPSVMICECGCGAVPARGKRFLKGHWAKANRALIGAWKRTDFHKPDARDGYIRRGRTNERRLEHVQVVERVLGKPLPPKAVVHHIDENRSNNHPANLVICPDHAYHALIHRRMRALAECGHAHWRKCWICKKYDDPKNLAIPKREDKGCIQHLSCLNALRANQKRTPPWPKP